MFFGNGLHGESRTMTQHDSFKDRIKLYLIERDWLFEFLDEYDIDIPPVTVLFPA